MGNPILGLKDVFGLKRVHIRLRLRVLLETAVPFSSIHEKSPPEGGLFRFTRVNRLIGRLPALAAAAAAEAAAVGACAAGAALAAAALAPAVAVGTGAAAAAFAAAAFSVLAVGAGAAGAALAAAALAVGTVGAGAAAFGFQPHVRRKLVGDDQSGG